MNSKRLPKKAVAEILGRPLISHLIERVQKAKEPQSVILCTSYLQEDAVLLEEAKKCGIAFVAGDPENIFQRFLEAAFREKADHIVRVTGDNPLTDPVTIDRLTRKHLAQKNEFTMMEGLPLGVAPEVISVKSLERAYAALKEMKQTGQSEYMVFLLSDSKKYKTGVLSADTPCRRPHYRLTVDTPADLELMRLIYRNLYRPGKVFSLKEVIDLLDANPDWLQINSKIKQKFFDFDKRGGVTLKPVDNWVLDVIKERNKTVG